MADSLSKLGGSSAAEAAAKKVIAVISDCPPSGCQAGVHTITSVVEASLRAPHASYIAGACCIGTWHVVCWLAN